MSLTPSHPFWSVNNRLPADSPSLQGDVVCDAVVIGGGITGALVAVHLVEIPELCESSNYAGK
jgi:cytoskeletal protein CcmA (bactofilin family)